MTGERQVKGPRQVFSGVRALRSPAFRALFTAQVVSVVGTWSQNLATTLLVLHLTGSAAALGTVTAAQTVPILLLAPVTGRVIDRANVRMLLIATGSAAAATAFTVSALAATGHAPVWALTVAAALFGTASAFDRPGQYALLPAVVDDEARPSAISLTTTAAAAGRLGGPALAALIYGTAGPAACFAFNGASYLAVVGALVVLPRFAREGGFAGRRKRKDEPADNGDAEGIGLRYAWRNPDLRAALLVNTLIGCLSFNFGLMLAAMVTFTYKGGSSLVGLAYTTDAVGAVLGGVLGVGAALLTRRRLALACAALGLTICAAGAAPDLVVFFAVLPVMGVAISAYQTSVTALVQKVAAPHMLGRAMSLLTLGWFGTTPLGALLAGWVADVWSARATMGMAGAASLLGALALLWRPARGAVSHPRG